MPDILATHRLISVRTAVGKRRFSAEAKARRFFMRPWSKVLLSFKKQMSSTKRFRFKIDPKARLHLKTNLNVLLTSMYEFGAMEALESLGFRGELRGFYKKAADDVVFTLSSEEILAALLARAADSSTFMMSSVAREANHMVGVGLASGLALNEIRSNLEAWLGDESQAWRAYRAVNTEFQYAVNTARFDMFERSGVQKKRWITVGDNRVRPTHHRNEIAGWIPMSDQFPNGTMKPGEGTDGINCRCVLEADLSNPSIVLEPWTGD